MSLMTAGDGYQGRRFGLAKWSAPVGLTIALGPVLAVASAILWPDHARSRSDLHHLAFGHPFGWISQDQTPFTPTQLPGWLTLASPYQAITHVQLG